MVAGKEGVGGMGEIVSPINISKNGILANVPHFIVCTSKKFFRPMIFQAESSFLKVPFLT